MNGDDRHVQAVKCWPDVFQAVLEDRKTAEFRFAGDRVYRRGELLELEEWEPQDSSYTGRRILCEITDVQLAPAYGLPPKRALISIRAVDLAQIGAATAGTVRPRVSLGAPLFAFVEDLAAKFNRSIEDVIQDVLIYGLYAIQDGADSRRALIMRDLVYAGDDDARRAPFMDPELHAGELESEEQ